MARGLVANNMDIERSQLEMYKALEVEPSTSISLVVSFRLHWSSDVLLHALGLVLAADLSCSSCRGGQYVRMLVGVDWPTFDILNKDRLLNEPHFRMAC